MKRREFIRLSATASALGLIPSEVGAALKLANTAFNCDVSNRKLVLIELRGGNDGLNTIIPYDNYGYYKETLRADIHIPVTSSNYNALKVDGQLSGTNQDLVFNPALLTGANNGFKGLYQSGNLRLIQSVGYPAQNRSHFASIDLWATGNDGNSWDNGNTSGWMGRFMENAYADLLPSNYPFAIQLGSNNNWLGFHAEHEHGLDLNIDGQNSENFYSVLSGLAGQAPSVFPNSHFGEELRYITDTDAFANTYANAIETSFNNGSNLNNAADYPDTDLANQLKTVARLIRGGIDTKIYMVTIGGFDTHNQQNQAANDINGTHTELLNELSGAVDAFVQDINSDSIGDDIVGLTFSEFGRKAMQNGNLGTDHGQIAPMFVFGNSVNGGVSGVNVDLNEATAANRWQFETVQHDYRQVFGTLLQDFLGADNTVLDKTFFDHTNTASFADATMDEIIQHEHKACASLSINAVQSPTRWVIYPNPADNFVHVRSIFDEEGAPYKIYNTSGALVKSGHIDVEAGKTSVLVSDLASGIYIFEIGEGKTIERKKLIV